MAVVYSKVLLFDPPLIYTAPDTCVFGAVRKLEHVWPLPDQFCEWIILLLILVKVFILFI